MKFTTRGGRRWRGPFPLHRGAGPNFSVDTETLAWTQGADFVALVRTLAETVGVDDAVLDKPRTPEDNAHHSCAS